MAVYASLLLSSPVSRAEPGERAINRARAKRWLTGLGRHILTAATVGKQQHSSSEKKKSVCVCLPSVRNHEDMMADVNLEHRRKKKNTNYLEKPLFKANSYSE